jgi:hypothetical protein
MNNFYQAALLGVTTPRIHVLIGFFNWLAYFFVSVASLIPSVIVRYFLPGRHLDDEWAIMGAFVNGGTILMIASFPWQLVTVGFRSGTGYYLISCLLKIISALIVIYCGYGIITKPDDVVADQNFAPPVDNATKCMLRLRDFKDEAGRRLGRQTDAEKLWGTVYAYLKDDKLVTDAISKGIPIDAIVMNAVGAVAYKLIESGLFHSAKGVLSPDGVYIAEVWKLAADELVSRSFNTRDDMERGMALLRDAIERAG